MAGRPNLPRPPREYNSRQRRIFQRKLSLQRMLDHDLRREAQLLKKRDELQATLPRDQFAGHPIHRQLKSLDRLKRKSVATIAAIDRVLSDPSRSEE